MKRYKVETLKGSEIISTPSEPNEKDKLVVRFLMEDGTMKIFSRSTLISWQELPDLSGVNLWESQEGDPPFEDDDTQESPAQS